MARTPDQKRRDQSRTLLAQAGSANADVAEIFITADASGINAVNDKNGTISVTFAHAGTFKLFVHALDKLKNPVIGATLALHSSVTAKATVAANVTSAQNPVQFTITGVAAGTTNVTATCNSLTSNTVAVTCT